MISVVAAIPVLVVTVLGASTTEVGSVSAAQFVPYLLVGLVAGVLVGWIGAPFTVLVDAATYVTSAVLIASTPVTEERTARTTRPPRVPAPAGPPPAPDDPDPPSF